MTAFGYQAATSKLPVTCSSVSDDAQRRRHANIPASLTGHRHCGIARAERELGLGAARGRLILVVKAVVD